MKLFNEYRGLRKENYVLFIGRIMTSFGSMIYPMMTLILSQKLNISASMIAIVMVVYSMVAIPANLVGGKLADMFNKKTIIVTCSCISVCCYICCSIFPLSYGTMILFACGAIVGQMQNSSYSALIADITPAKDRSRAYSLSYLGINVGMVLSPTIGGILFQNYLWLMFLISGLCLLASTCLIIFCFDSHAAIQENESEYERSDEKASVINVLKQNKIILLFFAVMAIDNAVYNQYGYLMPLNLGAIHGDQGAVIYGTLSSLNCLIVVIFTPIITRVFTRRNEVQKLLIGEVLMVVSYIIFQILLGFIPSYYVAMSLFTWGEIFRTISADPYLTRRVPKTHRGRLLSINAVAASLAYSFASIGVGRTYDAFGANMAWALVIGLGCFDIVLCLCLMKMDRRVYPEIYQKNS